MFVWLNTDRSRPRRVECRPLPSSSPLSFRRSMLCCSGLSMFRKFLKPRSTSALPSCRPDAISAVLASLSSRSFPLTLTWPGQFLSPGQPRWKGRRGQPRWKGRRGQPRWKRRRGQPRWKGRRGQPRWKRRRGQPRWKGRRGQPRWKGRRGQPHWKGRRGQPRWKGRRGQPRWKRRRGQPSWKRRRGQPRWKRRRGQPRWNGRRGQTEGGEWICNVSCRKDGDELSGLSDVNTVFTTDRQMSGRLDKMTDTYLMDEEC